MGVEEHMARFSNKTRWCPSCVHKWTGHEEKETDVKIAVQILLDASLDKFDRAMLISRDSDLVPMAVAFKQMYPQKELYVVAPPCAGHSTEMLQHCTGKFKIKVAQLDDCLLPAEIILADGSKIIRPANYDPPA